jgi:hypothetical protein
MPFAIERSPEISHRCDFPLLCNARGHKDAVEVGVDQGVFAAEFLRRFQGHWLILVDPYEPYPEQPYDRSADVLVAALALMPYHGRYRFVRARSPGCVGWVLSFCRPEFVYLDGSHDEADVAADLEGWWPALPDHGMIAGHDWHAEHPGVKAAVEGFARRRGLVVRLTGEAVGAQSWYMYKKEPETLFVRLFTHADAENPRYVAGRE